MKPAAECRFPVTAYTDELTGRPVRRIGAPEWRTHHQYFYVRMWTPDSRRVVLSSNRDDGVYRHYLVDVQTGQAVCLTDGEDLATLFGELSPDGRRLMYATETELRLLDLGDFSQRTAYVQPPPWNARSVYYGATAEHRRAVMVEMHAADAVPPGAGWETFEPQFAARPRCRLVELDVQTSAARVIHEDRCWLGHPNYRPDGRTIMFCHEGPWELVDSRLWFIDPDGGNLRQGRRRDPSRPPGRGSGELWGHEYWLADSSRAAYVYFPRTYGHDATMRLLDPDSLVEEVLMPVSSYSHFISNADNSLIVADGQAGLSEAIWLVDVAARSESILCRHGSSMEPYVDPRTGRPNTQEVHPHPCFSPDSRRVVFTSDRDGFPAVYVTEIQDLP